MNRGMLADYFTGVAAKQLREVEANPSISNQHEFNGVSELRTILGTPTARQRFPARFIYLNDGDDEPVIEDAFLTWYDARRCHPTRAEWRLYFPKTTVSDCAAAGDLMVIGRRQDDSLLAVIAEEGSTVANQILWPFGISDIAHPGFSIRSELETQQDRLGFASRLILESIGVEPEVEEETLLDQMLNRFGEKFPTTKIFSAFGREVVGETDILAHPDTALMVWTDKEEILFRTLEKHLVAERLLQGFEDDVNGFLAYSLKVQNRRKSRVGYALENHLEAIFLGLGLRHKRSAETENKVKADFLFPGVAEYHDPAFDATRLTMLGAKSTCKDRWRQVLSEATRVTRKHLVTLETAISTNQTNEMEAQCLQLVVPQTLHQTYTAPQQDWLMDVGGFCQLVASRQPE